MSILKSIKNHFLQADLKRAILHRHYTKKVVAFEQCKSIGILYMVGEEKDQIEYTKFVGSLQAKGKDVKSLGIINYKDIPHYCYPKLAYDYLTLKDINWIKKPTGTKCKDFIKKDFDYLINFDTTQNATLNYIAALSLASCKIGLFSEEHQDIYDFMIESKKDSTFQELSEQYFTYIGMFLQNH